ncbi:MAG: hypothetical protein PVH85_31210, partial [Desulfobacterales bacterium]
MTRVSASNPQDTDQLYFTNRYGTGNFYLGIKGDPNLLSVQLFENLWFLIDEDLQPQNQKKPDEISLADAWSGDFGSIVLLGSASTNHQLLTRGLKEKLVGTRPGLLWLANPNDAFEHWNLACAEFVEEKISSKILATRQLKKDFRLGFSADANGYGLCAAEKSLFNLDAVSGLLQITPHTDNADGVSFCRGDFTAPISSQSIDLQLGGSYGIAFNFELMTNGGMATTDWFDQFDVGIRYASASESGVGNTSQRFPVFQPHSATPALAIKAQIIPTHLLEPDLTRLAISWSEEVLFLSWFRTVLGNQIFLSTRRMDLSFALAAPSEIGRTPEFYTLVVGGKFSLSFANLTTHDESKNAEVNMQSVMAAADANPQFLCGISGSEYVEFDDLNNIKLALLPGYPAFALAVNNTRRDSAADTALIPATTTSWIQLYRIQQSDDDYVALPYYAQPAGNAILYKIREVPESPTESAAPLNDVDIPIYPYFAIQAGQVAYDTPIPLISLAGIGEAELPFASLLEVTSISTERRSIIATDRRNALVSAQARPCLPLHPFVSSRTESAAQNDAEEKITIDCITPQGL